MELPVLNDNDKAEVVEKYQCPGCMLGGDTGCGSYELENDGPMFRCKEHTCGTNMFAPGIGQRVIALGFPKGFNIVSHNEGTHRWPIVRIYQEEPPLYDHLNVPVWAMEDEGDLFIRCFMPRLNKTIVDIIVGGKREEICPQSINVADFIDEID